MALLPLGEINEITDRIIGCAIRVHRTLGPGLLHAPYLFALNIELDGLNIEHALEVPLPVTYEGKTLPCGYRLDMVVEGKVVVEVKSVERLLPIHRAQLITYLKLGKYAAGLLLNFNAPLLKDGLVRVVNSRDDASNEEKTKEASASSV